MRPVLNGLVRWLICLAALVLVCALVLFFLDDSAFSSGHFFPQYGLESISVYGIWAGVADVILLAGVPIAIFVLLRRFLMPTKGLKILVGCVLGLFAALVVALEMFVATTSTMVVNDFTLFPTDVVARRDQEAVQALISALKSRETEKVCDDAFMLHDSTASADQAEISRLHNEYSFDRALVVGDNLVDIKAPLTLKQLVDVLDATPKCMARYEKLGDESFQAGAFARAAQLYEAAASLAMGGSEDESRLLAMRQAMTAAAQSNEEAGTEAGEKTREKAGTRAQGRTQKDREKSRQQARRQK